ncbi:MAG: MFS transporter [Phascolarctobacterium sp.]|nr:MFS transporter [Phascolarctobacterium sp.]
MKYTRAQWLLILVCTLMIFCSVGMGTATFSVYLPYFINIHGFSNTQTSFLVSLRTIAAFSCMLLVTKYFKYFSLRVGMSVAMVGCALSFVIMGFTSNYYFNCFAVALLGSTYTFASMYPLTLLMTKWFGDRSAVPLSISSCGSGVAAIIMPTVVTYIIDRFSLREAFCMDAGVTLLSALLIYIFVRDVPKEENEDSEGGKSKQKAAHRFREISPKHFLLLMLAVTFNGSLTLAGWGHFAVLIKTTGYTSMQAAVAISMGGVTLTLSKFFYGFITDKIHTYKSNFVFCTLVNLGFLLCLLLPLGYSWLPVTISILMGLGCPISTLGIAMWAKEVSSPLNFPENLRKLQTCHQLGGLIFANAPGMLADLTGSYVPSYVLFSVLGLISYVIIQFIYAKNKLYNIYD